MRPSDDRPFLFFAAEGPWAHHTYRAELVSDATLEPEILEGIGSPGSCIYPTYSPAFGPNDGAEAYPSWTTNLSLCTVGGWLALRKPQIVSDISGVRSSHARGADGTDHILWNSGHDVYYTQGPQSDPPSPVRGMGVHLFKDVNRFGAELAITVDALGVLKPWCAAARARVTHAAPNSRVALSLSGFELVSVAADRGTANGNEWSLGTLAPGESVSAIPSAGSVVGTRWEIGTLAQSATLTLRLRGVQVGTASARSNFTIHSSTRDPRPDNNRAVLQVQVTPHQADLVATASATPSVARAGDDVRYSLALVNNGPSSADGAVLTAEFSGDLRIRSAPAECTVQPAKVRRSFGDVAPGAGVPRIRSPASGDLRPCETPREPCPSSAGMRA